MKRNSYVLVESVKQGNVETRETLTFREIEMIRYALRQELSHPYLTKEYSVKIRKLLTKLKDV